MSGPGDSTSSKVLLEELLRLYSDLSAAHRELESKNAQLEALDTAKNQLIGIVAHDLRNPIGIIQSYAGFLLADAAPHLAPADVEALRIIHQQASFLLRMVSDLLDFAAIESGRLELRPQCDDFVALVEQVVERNRVLAEPKNIAIELDTGSAAPPVLFDGHRIEQVLNNLIGNAV
jgi:signal transduction histidine kinase